VLPREVDGAAPARDGLVGTPPGSQVRLGQAAETDGVTEAHRVDRPR
jgi:hypothetical protein